MSCPVRPVPTWLANLALCWRSPHVGSALVVGEREHHDGQMGPSLSELRAGQSGPCAYPLSEAAAGFAPQPREARGAGATTTTATLWMGACATRVESINRSINKSINKSSNHMCGEDHAALQEATATRSVNGLVPSPWAPMAPTAWGSENLGSAVRAQPRSPIGSPGRRKRISRETATTTPRHARRTTPGRPAQQPLLGPSVQRQLHMSPAPAAGRADGAGPAPARP